MREMIRKKQQLSAEACVQVLTRNTNGVLAVMGDEGYPYGVPVSYVYHNGKIYFHSGKHGYKVECMEKSPKVSFTVIDKDEIVEEEYTSYFRSVIATGRVRLTEGDEHREGFLALVDKYSGSMPEAARVKEVDDCHAAAIYAVDVEVLTGKQARELIGKPE